MNLDDETREYPEADDVDDAVDAVGFAFKMLVQDQRRSAERQRRIVIGLAVLALIAFGVVLILLAI